VHRRFGGRPRRQDAAARYLRRGQSTRTRAPRRGRSGLPEHRSGGCAAATLRQYRRVAAGACLHTETLRSASPGTEPGGAGAAWLRQFAAKRPELASTPEPLHAESTKVRRAIGPTDTGGAHRQRRRSCGHLPDAEDAEGAQELARHDRRNCGHTWRSRERTGGRASGAGTQWANAEREWCRASAEARGQYEIPRPHRTAEAIDGPASISRAS
jgi:hypothetical protein